MRLGASAAALVFVSSSCATFSAPLTPPKDGGPEWIEVVTPHFIVHADTNRSEALRRARDLEQLDADLRAIAFNDAPASAEQLEVDFFSRSVDFEALGHGERVVGWTSFAALERDRVVIRSGIDDPRLVVQAELARHVVHHLVPAAPAWLSSGMASFYRTMRIADGKAHIGEPPFNFARDIDMATLPPPSVVMKLTPRDLAAKDADAFDKNAAGAWLLVSMLINGADAEHFWAYVNAIASGTAPEQAFAKELGALPLDDELAAYRKSGRVGVLHVPYQPAHVPDDAFTARVLRDDEVRDLFASVLPPGPQATQLAQQALAEAPSSAEASFRVGLIDFRARAGDFGEARFRTALAIAPKDERFILAVFHAGYERETAKPERERNLKRLMPDAERAAALTTSVDAQNSAAWYFADVGDAARGVWLARQSLALDPSCWSCMDTLARLLSITGDAREAANLQRRAIAAYPGEPPKDVLEPLAKYEAAAASAATAETSSSPAAP